MRKEKREKRKDGLEQINVSRSLAARHMQAPPFGRDLGGLHEAGDTTYMIGTSCKNTKATLNIIFAKMYHDKIFYISRRKRAQVN